MQKGTLAPPGTLCLNSGWKKEGNDTQVF